MSIGSQLTKLRNEKGLTRVQLAEELCIPMTTLRNYEQDIREPGHKFLLEASRYFGVTTDYILENEIAPEPEGTEAISRERSDRLYGALVAAGLIVEDDLVPQDIEFLGRVVDLLDVWFASKHRE